MTCAQTMTLGVYLLGALEPGERAEFEAHLAGCDLCRAELVRLSPLPGLLHQISEKDFADDAPLPVPPPAPLPAPPPQLPEPLPEPVQQPAVVTPLPPVPAQVGHGPDTPGTPRWYRLVGAAAVVVLLTVGVVFGWQALRHEDTATPQGDVWSATEPETGVTAEARLVDHEWGTEIQTKVQGVEPGKKCYLVVYDHYGKSEVAGWWRSDHDPNAEIPASTTMRRSKIEKIEVKVEDEYGSRTLAVTIPEYGQK